MFETVTVTLPVSPPPVGRVSILVSSVDSVSPVKPHGNYRDLGKAGVFAGSKTVNQDFCFAFIRFHHLSFCRGFQPTLGSLYSEIVPPFQLRMERSLDKELVKIRYNNEVTDGSWNWLNSNAPRKCNVSATS